MRARLVGAWVSVCFAFACSSESSSGDRVASGGGTASGGTGTAGTGGVTNGASGGTAGAMTAAGGAPSSGGASAGGSPPGAGGTVIGGGTGSGGADDAGTPTGAWKPAPGTSWQWQLSGKLDSSFDVAVYDIDLYETTPAEIAALHAAGRKVVCYFDTAYEPGRPDSKTLEPFRGNPVDGWPGQFWLDVREPAVLTVMKARIALAEDKGCDGVEADDVDSRSNDPGFPIKKADQEGFIRALAAETHAKGLAFGLKNDLDEVPDLVGVSDFAVNEECFMYDECDALAPFISAGKAVFQVEYTDGDLAAKGASFCATANSKNFDSLVKHLDLDAPRYSCR